MINRTEILKAIQDKDHKKAYEFSKEIKAASAASDEYYLCFDDFASLLTAKNSYVRTRGFALCCAQARWDKEGRLQKAFPVMITLLYDEKPTVVRQCLAALHEVVLFKPELSDKIYKAVKSIDLTRYKDSVAPLIKKDADELLKILASSII